MYCCFCGTKMPEEAVFCASCGKKMMQSNNEEYQEKLTVKQSDKGKSGLNMDLLLAEACRLVVLDNTYCEQGFPIIKDKSKRCFNARNNFDIPSEEEIYVIYDSTLLGGCRKGFAICSSGIYYKESEKGFYSWDEFMRMNCELHITGLRIGNEEFNTATDGRKLNKILQEIRLLLEQRNYMC